MTVEEVRKVKRALSRKFAGKGGITGFGLFQGDGIVGINIYVDQPNSVILAQARKAAGSIRTFVRGATQAEGA